ncbi:hypothetical protein [Methylobacterium sp.]|uniref:hypothetical protein n=1 Tax=Methylobacterium sp. TaxID=409 RepID=UPI00257EAE39|nr:hypothetical protein [Methylobacterium sp.]
MVGLLLKDFTGGLPIQDVRQLPDNAAALSVNQRLGSGALEPIRQPRAIRGLNAATRYVYRIVMDDADAADITKGFWWQHSDPNTDVVRGPTVNDAFKRYYACSPAFGLQLTTRDDIIAGNAPLKVGVGRPTGTPTLTVDSTNAARDPQQDTNYDGVIDANDEKGDFSSPIETRAYLVTFINVYGEESGPSPTAEGTGPTDAKWTLSNIPQPDGDPSRATIINIRVYRTSTAASGSTVFNFVTDLAVGTGSYVDTVPNTIVSGTTILATTNSDVPPDDMQGIALMPNGIMVGFKDNNLYFSDNFQPWSWPADYTLTVPHDIIGLAVIGNTCVVCTTSNPSALTGSTGATMALSSSDSPMPCYAKQSIVVAPEGVYWATTDGLAMYSLSGGAKLITNEIIGRYKWTTDYPPARIAATFAYGGYIGIVSRPSEGRVSGFGIASGCVIGYDEVTDALKVGLDHLSGKPWIIKGNTLYEWMPSDTPYKTLTWRSKQFQTPVPVNMGVVQAYFDAAYAGSVHVKVMGEDGALRFEGDLTDRKIRRMPSSTKDGIHQIEISCATMLHRLAVAQTVDDLKRN